MQGGYNGSLTKFYLDVTLLLENAIAYNHENQPLNVHAQKLAVVFERMFLEVVLSWDNPLPFSDSCHGCRSMESCQVTGYKAIAQQSLTTLLNTLST